MVLSKCRIDGKDNIVRAERKRESCWSSDVASKTALIALLLKPGDVKREAPAVDLSAVIVPFGLNWM